MRNHKYGAKRCIVTTDGTLFEVEQLKAFKITDVKGITFDSKAEAEYYLVLRDRLNRGEIQVLTLQPKYILQDKPRITYRADFEVMHHGGDIETIDVKGFITKEFSLKKRLFKATYEDHKLTLVTKKGGRWQEVTA